MAVDDLIVNEHKTEDTNRLKDKNDEECLLGCYEDMKRRIQLSYAAFNTIKKIWYHRKIHISKKLQLYKSTVKPILLYNSGTWGLIKNKMKLMLLIKDY